MFFARQQKYLLQRKNNKLLLVAMFLLLLSALQAEEDPFFKQDIVAGEGRHLFSPDLLPRPGSSERDLLKKNPFPYAVRSFKKKLQRILGNKTIPVSRIYTYYYNENPAIKNGEDKSKDFIMLFVFIHDGLVADYRVDHMILSGNGSWKTGPYQREPEGFSDAVELEQSITEQQCYWLQRQDRGKWVTGTSLWKCPFWEAEPQAE